MALPTDFAIPDSLVSRVAPLGEHGKAWLASLPSIVGACLTSWSLELEGPVEQLWYNYVAKVRLGSEALILKVCYPDRDIGLEADALRFFDGRGCVRLLAFDSARRALLLERADPGLMIETLRDPAVEITAAVQLMQTLWRAPPPKHRFPSALRWLEAALDPVYLPGTKARFQWVMTALERAYELTADARHLYLMHGDLHEGNILSAEREPWLAIDPLAIEADAAWEVGGFIPSTLKRDAESERRRAARLRAHQFADELGFDRERVYAAAAGASLYAAYEKLTDDVPANRSWHAYMACAEALTVNGDLSR